MNKGYRQYKEHIAAGLRYAQQKYNKNLEDCILVVQKWSVLSEYYEIIGLPIYISDFNSSDEFILATNSDDVTTMKQVSAFKEYMQLNLGEWYE